MMQIEHTVAGLLGDLGARAAGFWSLSGGELVLRAFVPAVDLDAEVARTFAEATRRVPLDRAELGIVRAFTTAEPTVTTVAAEPADAGSGKWLRAFGAQCSIAVPLTDAAGRVRAVLSVALPTVPAKSREVIERIRLVGATLRDA